MNFLDVDEVKIVLPTQLKIEYIPEKVELNTKFGTYSIEMIKIDDYNYLYKRTLKIKDPGQVLKNIWPTAAKVPNTIIHFISNIYK